MYYSLVNLEGKTLDAFRNESAAREALRATVEANPSLADEVLLLRNTDEGEQSGRALLFQDLLPAKVGLGAVPLHASISAPGAVEMVGAAFGYLVSVPPSLLGRELATRDVLPAPAPGAILPASA